MENQQEQTETLHQRLFIEPRKQKLGNVSDFRITGSDLFGHGEAPGCRVVAGRHDRSSEGSPSP